MSTLTGRGVTCARWIADEDSASPAPPGAVRSVGEGWWIDAVEIGGRVGGLERVRVGAPWPPSGRRSRGQAEVIQDSPCGMLILDEGDEAHGAGAGRAPENVEAEGALEEAGPVEAPGAVRIVGGVGARNRIVRCAEKRWNSFS